jgi:hypothetical protein
MQDSTRRQDDRRPGQWDRIGLIARGIRFAAVLREPAAEAIEGEFEDPDRLEKMYWEDFRAGRPHRA